ncbi:MAG: CHAT domain-containing protein [Deltaproteobacteria bacterium]|nr:CHAT domain-containing protein [Deltaproteobacteria bacterium]
MFTTIHLLKSSSGCATFTSQHPSYSGTPSLVASLWQVSDRSTSPLMEFFYRHLKEGRPKAEALRQAKMELMQTSVWNKRLQDNLQLFASPSFWAPFILIGSGS